MLAGTQKKVCPHCGSTMFKAMIKIPAIIEISVGEKDEEQIEVKNSTTDSVAEYEVIACNKCNAHITNDDLNFGARCIVCNELVDRNEIDERGYCAVCAAKEKDPGLEKLSVNELIRRMLNAQKELEKAQGENKHPSLKKEAEAVEEAKASEQPVEEPKKEEKKKTRSVKKKDQQQQAEESTEQPENNAEEVKEEPKEDSMTSAIDDLMNNPTADPFSSGNYNLDDLLGKQEEQPKADSNPVSADVGLLGQGFPVFQGGNDAY